MNDVMSNRTMGQWQYLLLAATTITLATLFAMLLRWPGWSDRRSVLLAALTIGNLFVANIGTNLSDFGPARKALLPPEVAALQAAVATSATANLGIPGRVYNEFRVYEDYSMRAAVEDVWGASPLRLARYAALFDEFPLDRMWRLTGVEHVRTEHAAGRIPAGRRHDLLAPAGRAEPAGVAGGAGAHRRR